MEKVKLSNEIISSIARTYQYISRIDIQADYFEEINNRDTEHLKFTKSGKLSESNEKVCRQYVAEEYQEAFFKFVDLKTLPERMKNEETLVLEYRMKDGDWHRLRFVEKKRDENGVLTHVLCLIRSISDTKKWEHELMYQVEEARKAAALKARFLSNMSHDIRTPMNAIIGFADLLEKHIDEKERVRDYIGKIKSSSEFLLSLINYVLETARIESGKTSLKKEVRCVSGLIESLADIFEPEVRKKGLTYSYTKDIQHDYVIGDETKVREIFINIIGNSLKYTPAGGKITIDIKELSSDRENYIAYKIVVEDTGIGMSKEYLPHIFEEFSREHTSTESKVVGTGLGLPIVKALIDLMGGTIEIENEVGKGTKTTVMIPFEIATQEQILEEKQKEKEFVPEDIKGKRILVAEDNELNAEITLTVLKEKGLLVERAANGKECVEMLKEKPADYYDMILMDIQMPEMDGYQATEMIRNLGDSRAAVPIVAMTANAFEEDRQKALDAGMNAHVSKPVDMNVLFRVMAKFI